MKLLPYRADRVRTSVSILTALALAMAFMAGAGAQTPSAESSSSNAKPAPTVVDTVHLTHVTANRDLNDIQTDLRNMLPMAAIYGAQTQSAISIRATPEDIETAKKLIAELDRPRKTYRVTYTFTDMDNGKPVGVQHLTLLVVAGEKSIVKHGNRVPIVTGMFEKEGPSQSSQVQYLDVGLTIEASLDSDRLHSKVEQSNISDEKSGIGMQDPVVHQTMLEATSDLGPGKNSVLGSLDIPGTTRHQQIEAVAEPLQ
jgi:type II secretory pathway component GspD/PulD (secretin)